MHRRKVDVRGKAAEKNGRAKIKHLYIDASNDDVCQRHAEGNCRRSDKRRIRTNDALGEEKGNKGEECENDFHHSII